MFQVISEDKIWNAVRKIRAETSLNKECDGDLSQGYIFQEEDVNIQVTLVEQYLQIKASEHQLENLLESNLTKAAEMFIYLNLCPNTDEMRESFNTWSAFYSDLFQQSPDKILLTLNRLMKTLDKDDKVRNEKVFKKTSNLLSLNQGELHSMSLSNTGKYRN